MTKIVLRESNPPPVARQVLNVPPLEKACHITFYDIGAKFYIIYTTFFLFFLLYTTAWLTNIFFFFFFGFLIKLKKYTFQYECLKFVLCGLSFVYLWTFVLFILSELLSFKVRYNWFCRISICVWFIFNSILYLFSILPFEVYNL